MSNTILDYGGALARLFGLPTASVGPAPVVKRVPVRLPTDDDAADKAMRMVRSVRPDVARRVANTRSVPVRLPTDDGPDKNSGLSLADLVAGRKAKPEPQVSTLDSIIANVGDLGGLGRLAYAAGDAGGNALGRLIMGRPQDFETDFDNARNRKTEYLAAATRQHPYASWAGWLTGAAPALAALPTARIAEGTGLATRAGIRAAEGGGYGAAFGALDANKGNRAMGAVKGGAAGAVLAPVLGAAADKVLPKLGQIVADWRRTEKAVDPDLPSGSPFEGQDFGPTTTPSIKTPGQFVDRLNKEGPQFLDSPEGADYFTRNAGAIRAELDKRTSGSTAAERAAGLDRRATEADAYYNGPKRRARDVQPEVTPTSSPAAQPVDMTPAPFEPTAGPVNDNVPPPLGPMADTAAGAPDTLSFPKGDVDVDLRSTEGLKALMAERGIDPEAMLSRDPVTPTAEPVNPLGTAGNDALAARATPEGQIGSRDPEAMGLTPDQTEAMKLGADYGNITPEVRSRADTEKAGDALGYGPGNVPPVGDLSAQISAGEKATTKAVDDVFDAVNNTGSDSQETVDALDKFVETFGPHSQNVGETGRALNILRKPEYDAKGAKIGDAESAKIVRENLADPATRDAAVEAIKAAKGDKNALAQVARKLKTNKADDFISRTYYAAWLSDPASQSRNIVGNTEKIVSDMAMNGLTAVAGLPAKLSGTSNRVFGREVAGSLYGAMRGTLAGLKNLKTAYTRGAPLDQAGREGSVGGPGGIASNILEFGPRGMAAGDEFFRSVAFMSNMYREATRKAIIDAGEEGSVKFKGLFDDINNIVAKPDDSMIKSSVDYAKEARFQGEPGFVASGIERMLAPSKKDVLPTKVLKGTVRLGVLPFVRTPANILREAARMSPAGIASSRNWKAWRAGGPEAQVATARVAFGTGVAALVWSGVNNDSITGNGPSDYKKLAALKDTGWTPNSIKIGNKYYPYEGLGPLSVMLSGVATSAERYKAGEIDGKAFSDRMASAALGVADASIHNGWMSSLADTFDALGKTSDDERSKAFGDVILGQATSPLQPGLARAINQSWFDPYARETKGSNAPGFSGSVERAGNRIKTVWPGLSDTLPVKKDTLGEPILNRRGGGGLGAFVSPSVPVLAKDDPVTVELGRLERGLGNKALIPPVPTTIQVPGAGPQRLNGEQYQDYQAFTGAAIKMLAGELMQADGWDKLSDTDKRTLISSTIKDARKMAKEQFLDSITTAGPASGDKSGGGTDSPAPAVPSGGPETAGQPIDPEKQFIGIPTSIRRTLKGNEAVGGVANSDHVRGDAVDFVPPAGMSMKELEAAARRFFPGMFVLNEGDHVHVRIPGLNGPLFGKKGTIK